MRKPSTSEHGATPEARPCALRRSTTRDGARIGDIFLRAFHGALPQVRLAHTDDEARIYFATTVARDSDSWVAVESDDNVTGFITLRSGWIDHLYVAPERIGRGIGHQLLQHGIARASGPDGLRLYTFQANERARAFYESHGFAIVDVNDGERNEEREPDILYRRPP